MFFYVCVVFMFGFPECFHVFRFDLLQKLDGFGVLLVSMMPFGFNICCRNWMVLGCYWFL